jgi:hypothetical protein
LLHHTQSCLQRLDGVKVLSKALLIMESAL